METQDILKSIVRHIVFIVIFTFLTIAVTAFVCWNVLPKTYTSETTLYVLYRSSEESLNSSEMTLSSQLVNDYSELLKSNRVIDGAASILGIDSEEMQEDFKIEVETSTTTRLLRLKVTGESPAQVANLANALASELAKCIMDVANVANINIVDQAKLPSEPSGPESLKITGIAGLIALVFTIFLSVVIDSINVKIVTREDVQEILGVSVLAQIPLDITK